MVNGLRMDARAKAPTKSIRTKYFVFGTLYGALNTRSLGRCGFHVQEIELPKADPIRVKFPIIIVAGRGLATAGWGRLASPLQGEDNYQRARIARRSWWVRGRRTGQCDRSEAERRT